MTEPEPKPTITITFAGKSLADLRIEASDDVEPAQVYAAAFLFDLWAREVRDSILAQAQIEAMNRAAIARQIAGDLGRVKQ